MAQPRDLQWVDIYNITSTPHWAMSVPSAPTIATGVVVGGVESGVLGTLTKIWGERQGSIQRGTT